MSRSVWKLPFSEISSPSLALLRKAGRRAPSPTSNDGRGEHKTKIWSRRSTVLPQFIGGSFLVYNGKIFIPVKVSEEMTGHKFGEFATTRKRPTHKLSKRKQTRKK
uniref:Small ribosomal subunit protein uS19m n=1 Tax=Coccomyxa subellipsoidea (strain C-169) TaxID=574566 RepID=F1DPN8_COCSC|nr:ribosomal protein S19 [Coccomyxa subellipsoidea C-169]ADY75478.1 ribosomal protein S19 [Coccomyxa subellipsoidea C-169]